MEWIPIEPNNLPSGIVLAANFNPSATEYKWKLIGRLYLDRGDVFCENDDHFPYRGVCTHYIDIDKYDIEE